MTSTKSTGNGRASSQQDFGRFGEQCAADWYRDAGYEILARNWRCARGELDLIAANDELVVFVEVKARSSARFGSGADAVDWRKQRKVRAIASQWLEQRPESDRSYFEELRFDVVDVDAQGTLQVYEGCF